MTARAHISDEQRRARLAHRHGLTTAGRFSGPAAVSDALVALHATDTPTVHLSIAARTDGATVERTTWALGDGRELHRQMAMRRTQWAATDDVVDAMLAGPSVRVAQAERRRLVKELEASGVTVDGPRWLRRAEADVLAALESEDLTAAELAASSTRLARRVMHGAGTRWQTEVAVAPRLLTVMWAEGRVARAANDSSWVTNRSRWTTVARRRGERPPLPDERSAWADLVGRWLARFGPGTETDLRWWFGTTVAVIRAALADVGAVEVDLDGGATGWVAAGDEDPVADPGRWAALLPVLDPSTMGYKERAFYTGGHDAQLFDRAGNGGTSAWVDGQMVGGWSTTRNGQVRLHLLREVDAEALELLEQRAARLEQYLQGRGVTGMYSSPLVAEILRAERG
jgi:hypothetical protein